MQLLAIVVGALVLYRVLLWLPGIGGLFGAVPILGILICLLLVASLVRRFSAARDGARREGARLRDLERVDTPHQRGKLGAALLARGRTRAAIEPLEAARAGEPDHLEWAYRLGCARLATGDPARAAAELAFVVAGEEEYAYGAALMRLAEAQLASGDAAAALAALERVDQLRGASPESTYWRGRAHASAGDTERAKSAFAAVAQLARDAPKFQAGEAQRWVWRARWSALTGR